jgi:hypothetical protein
MTVIEMAEKERRRRERVVRTIKLCIQRLQGLRSSGRLKDRDGRGFGDIDALARVKGAECLLKEALDIQMES